MPMIFDCLCWCDYIMKGANRISWYIVAAVRQAT
ncbi:hypothetical protein SAMN04487787_104339 [Kosakonia sacchari]|nr:hypothetical protein SAMN04487787_104339 [Kosakonia sacchari]